MIDYNSVYLIIFNPIIDQQKVEKMGSSHIKDENITIFMQTNKQFYIAGDYVEGEIYLRVTQPSQYSKLVVNLHG